MLLPIQFYYFAFWIKFLHADLYGKETQQTFNCHCMDFSTLGLFTDYSDVSAYCSGTGATTSCTMQVLLTHVLTYFVFGFI